MTAVTIPVPDLEEITGLRVELTIAPDRQIDTLIGYDGDDVAVRVYGIDAKIMKDLFLERNLERIRIELREEQNGRCARCQRAVPLSLHHKKHRSQGRDDRRKNCEMICGDCHRGAHGEKSL